MRTIKVLGISGSPRRGGNTEILLDAALEGARLGGAQVDKLVLNELNIRPCQECGGCDKTGVCVIPDDMTLVYKKVEEADAIILASPIFFGNVSAQVKAMIDRFQAVWVGRILLKKGAADKRLRKGIFLSASASRKKEFFDNAKTMARIFFSTAGAEYFSGLFFARVESKGDMLKNKKALEKASGLGSMLVRSF